MTMSREILGMLVDLIENKLSCMQISDRDDMREVMMLQRALSELNGENAVNTGSAAAMPKRGRRRKLVLPLDEQDPLLNAATRATEIRASA